METSVKTLYSQLSHFNFKRETLLIRKTNMLNFGAQFSESKMMIITQNLLLRFSWSYFGKWLFPILVSLLKMHEHFCWRKQCRN